MREWKIRFAGLLGIALILVSCGPKREAAVSGSGELGRQELPEGSVFVDLVTNATLSGPFQSSQVDGKALVLMLPSGADATAKKTGKGRASVAVLIPSKGRYFGWLRARWEDSCSNSVGFKCAGLPEKTVGQDSVYNRWHWVALGGLPLETGEQEIALLQREDGIALDQLLLTQDESFRPSGRVSADGASSDLRRFGDDFMRSPGHGMEAWKLSEHWNLAFSFDPNRIPNQYALVGKSDGLTVATATPTGPAWRGCRIRSAIKPTSMGRFGIRLEGGAGKPRFVGIDLDGARGAVAMVDGQGTSLPAGVFRMNQWHELVIEYWACVTRIILDGETIIERLDSPVGPVVPSFAIASGSCVFDDVAIVEIPWAAEVGPERGGWLPWKTPKEGWFRPLPEDVEAAWCLMGEGGADAIRLQHPDHHATELLVTSAASADLASKTTSLQDVDLATIAIVPKVPTYYERIAVRFGTPEQPRMVTFGPYHFSDDKIEDPSDYLDFTEEEYAAIKASGESDRDRRQAKFRPLIGRSADDAVWVRKSGKCRVRDGVLLVDKKGTYLVHCRDIIGPFQLEMRVNLNFGTELYVRPYGGEKGVCVSTREANASGAVAVSPGEWHTIVVNVDPSKAVIVVPTAGEPIELDPQLTGDLALVLTGGGSVDDIKLTLPAGVNRSGLYEFANRETNWWREGGTWVDHGGISCTLSSSWVTLTSESDAHSVLWHKALFPSDVRLGVYLQEYSEWYGWQQRPTHVHEPYDNIILCFGTEVDDNTGYRLELNSRNRKQAVLYRDGVEVAAVKQDSTFPLRYVGSHEPFYPRTNHVRLVKIGATVTTLVNNVAVMTYEDPEPLPVSRVGLGGYQTHVNFSHIEIR